MPMLLVRLLALFMLPSGDLRYKIFFGEGFSSFTVVIQSSQIIDVVQI